MSEDEARWVAQAAVLYDCMVFVWLGRYGPQPILFPWSLTRGASTLQQV